MTKVPYLTLNNAIAIPQLGFGVFQVEPTETGAAVAAALRTGYRHIDTAEMYQNEQQVGRAIADSGIDRDEIFVTSKLNNNMIGFDATLAGFDQTLVDLGIERLDLFLIHWPLATVHDFVETWQAFERIYAEGRVRAIGVSNFQISHLERLFNETDIVPAVNQIELHPYLFQEKLAAFNAVHGIVTEAWSPLARGALIGDKTVHEIAKAYGRTPAQVVLRWHIQLGYVVFPRSVRSDRIEENFEIFDFALEGQDMDRVSALDRNERVGPDPDTFAWIPA